MSLEVDSTQTYHLKNPDSNKFVIMSLFWSCVVMHMFCEKQHLTSSSAHEKLKHVSKDCMINKQVSKTEQDSVVHRERDRSFRGL